MIYRICKLSLFLILFASLRVSAAQKLPNIVILADDFSYGSANCYSADIRHMRFIYYGMIKEVDDWIGIILKKLDDLGLTDNTLVIFTSDYGEMLGGHGMHSNMSIPRTNGISLRPFIGGNKVEHNIVSYSLVCDKPNYMVRCGNLKLMMGLNEKSRSINALYDLNIDPLEMHNLIVSPIALKESRELANKMKASLVQWLQQHEPHKVKSLVQSNLF